MRRALALEASPALKAPLRFFLAAPAFVFAAALLLAWAGPQALASRWSPYALAITHLLTLGALTGTMVGALIQILPVVVGIQIARPICTAAAVHALLTSGALTLAGAFVSGRRMLFALGALLLASAFAWLLTACAIGLWRGRRTAATGVADLLRAVDLALIALLVTASLGVYLALTLAWPHATPIVTLTNWHAIWGLAGWFGLLVVGIGYQLIPMFQVTEPYPSHLARWLAPGCFALLAGSALAAFVISLSAVPGSTSDTIAELLPSLVFVPYVVFATVTLWLLHRRKRPSPDATTLFWRTSMASLACCPLALAAATVTQEPRWFVAFGILALVGVGWSAVNGMLYKIVPFLLWYHLQAELAQPLSIVPKVKDIIPDRAAMHQYYAHLAALALLAAASQWPGPLARVAAFSLGVASVWLIVLLARALRLYARVRREIARVSVQRHERERNKPTPRDERVPEPVTERQ
ncbi:hypothetical protein WKR88_03105 [Trinickia caryophylli]|uniref:Uncharacterized protein n=1 Tax=Trinickia caryophylli TaxID=28094 RepID=A0A1X7FSM4_TRICW|nr:hypothetical protein [Trinickia caryophylli]WQE15576.1 hypothetical protein U0034_23955 [Trinickia caryophylli]GLU33669.1 hypothetical protein Busp01_35110 [Trinickia caryophylli]SMF58070.1 hypothetical protein SAMN06295900_11165 [Trinickia caryophylli]